MTHCVHLCPSAAVVWILRQENPGNLYFRDTFSLEISPESPWLGKPGRARAGRTWRTGASERPKTTSSFYRTSSRPTDDRVWVSDGAGPSPICRCRCPKRVCHCRCRPTRCTSVFVSSADPGGTYFTVSWKICHLTSAGNLNSSEILSKVCSMYTVFHDIVHNQRVIHLHVYLWLADEISVLL